MAEEMSPAMQLAALEGWATNLAVPDRERLSAAMQVIAGLREQVEGLTEEVDVLRMLGCNLDNHEAHEALIAALDRAEADRDHHKQRADKAEDEIRRREVRWAATVGENGNLRFSNEKLSQTIAAFPDAHDAANLAHARAERDELRVANRRLQHQIDRAYEALPESVDPENELKTAIRLLVETIAETRAVAAEDIARAIEGCDDGVIPRDCCCFDGMMHAAWIAREQGGAEGPPAAGGEA